MRGDWPPAGRDRPASRDGAPRAPDAPTERPDASPSPGADGVLFLVPARGGSVRVPRKNLRTVAGIPLVGHAVRVARRAARLIPGGPHAVVCSTDDTEIAALARAWGAEVPFARPAPLADGDATSVDVALHAVEALAGAGRRFRALALLQPSSPLTDPADVVASVARFDAEPGHPPVASVTPAHPAAWHAAGVPGPLDLVASGVAARHLLSGAVYVIGPAELARARRFVVPGRTVGLSVAPERSIDIDEPLDLAIAEALARLRPVRTVRLGDLVIGAGRCVVIAEAGVNHDGDVAVAHRLVDAAADAGADVVKFQTFDPARLAAAGAPTAAYQRAAGAAPDDQRGMLARLALPADAWPGLRDHARDRGLEFLSSPFDEASADVLHGIGVPAFKVGSGELTNHPFLAHLARFGRPLLVSTGMADMLEVAAALDVIEAAGDPPVALFHCVSSYPARAEDANLRAIETLRAAFGVPAGWSDHTTGIELDVAAAALGADLVEKHLTLDRGRPGPDHAASIEPVELAAMVRGIRSTEAALGSGEKAPVEAERDVLRVARKSLHWAATLPAGTVAEAGDFVALRPGTGIAPGHRDELAGRTLGREVRAGSMADPADFAPADGPLPPATDRAGDGAADPGGPVVPADDAAGGAP